jgi:rhodanese-related sulfurtransferase
MALCLQCDQENHMQFFDKTVRVAEWIKRKNRNSAIPPNAPPTTSKVFSPKNASIKITITNKDLPKGKILFWGAKPCKITDPILDASKSYGKYSNMGVTNVSSNGTITIICQCPAPYKENGKVWPPHIHFVTQNKSNKSKWDETVYVVAAYPGKHKNYTIEKFSSKSQSCFLTTKQVKFNWDKLIIVNALPYNEFNIKYNRNPKQIIHLPYNTIKDDVIKAAKKIKNEPCVVYCANPSCDAAHSLINRLVEAGCNRTYYMPEGVDGWNA